MGTRALGLALFIFTFAAAGNDAQGYALKTTPAGRTVRWPAESNPLGVALDVDGANEAMRALFAEAISGAVDEWNAASALRAAVVDDPAAAQIVVRWTAETFDDEHEELATTAIAYDSETGAVQHAIIRVNDSLAWIPEPAHLGVFDLQGTLTHELGHAYGLGHSDVPTATMFRGARLGDQWKRTLDPDDLEAVQRLYGPPGSSLEAEELPAGCSDVAPVADRGVSAAMIFAFGAAVYFSVFSPRVRRTLHRLRATRDRRGAPGATGRP